MPGAGSSGSGCAAALQSAQPRRITGRAACGWSAVFVLAFALVRVPLLHQGFVSEDGMFARIMRASWVSGQTPLAITINGRAALIVHGAIAPQFQGLIGRVAGRDLFTPLEHPAPLYRVLSWVGRVAAPFDPGDQSPSIEPFLRAEAAAAGLLVWLPLVVLSIRSPHGPLVPLVVIAAACSPLPALTSTMIQLDGSVGVLMIGALGIAVLAAAHRAPHDRRSWLTVGAAGVFVGLGKQEWSIVVLAAVVFTALTETMTSGRQEPSAWRPVLLVVAAAIVGGNALSYALDPLNYVGGFRVMGRFGASEATAGANLWRWIRVSYARVPMLVVLAPMLAVVAGSVMAMLRGAVRMHPMALLLSACALGLCGVFLASGWNATPRYLAPGFVAAVAALLAVIPGMPPVRARRIAQLIICAALVHTAWFEQRWLREQAPARAPAVARHDCLPNLDTAVTWNRPDVDFLSTDIEVTAAADIAAAFGRVLCR